MFRATVLIVDDDEGALNGLGHALWKSEFRLSFAKGAQAALELLGKETVEIVVTDHMMRGMTGLELLKVIRERHPEVIRIMLSGKADMETAVNAINQGEVFRFLLKPCEQAELLAALQVACEKAELERENRRLLTLIRSRPELLAELEEDPSPKSPSSSRGR